MSVLLARLGLTESRVASLSVLRRGRRQVRGGWLLGNGCQHARPASWWRKSDDEGGMGDETEMSSEEKLEREKREELDIHVKTSEIIRNIQKTGWGLNDEESRETKVQADQEQHETTRKDPGNWSQSSEDMYWEVTSTDVDDETPQKERPLTTTRGLTDDDSFNNVGRNEDSIQAAQINPPISEPRDALWVQSSQSVDANEEAEQVEGKQPYGLDEREWSPFDGPQRQSARYNQLLNINYEAELPVALENNDTDKVSRCLFAAQDRVDFGFVERIPEETFTHILHLLKPCHNMQEMRNTYLEMSEYMAERLGVVPIDRVMWEHSQLIQEVGMMRRRSGHRLTEEQYMVLLRSAQDLGDRELAKKLWAELQEDKIPPNVALYNAYLASYVWCGQWKSDARHRERVINFHMHARKSGRTDMSYANYHIGSSGVREQSMVILDAMLKSGVTADVETYCSIITAAAREGEMETVKSILRTVWGIDTGELQTAEQPERNKIPRDSPHYPTSGLLWTIAHAFGINNDIPSALHLVDYVSRQFEVTITQEVWEILFEWTFVLASHRSGTNARDDRKTGQLPKRSVESLWKTMIEAPYHVQPTMGMYNRMIINLSQCKKPLQMLEMMGEAAVVHEKSRVARDDAWSFFNIILETEESDRQRPATEVRQQWEHASIVFARNRQWMKRWVYVLCKSLAAWHRERYGKSLTHELFMRTIPDMLWRWGAYAGSYVKYELPTGMLEIRIRSDEEILQAVTAHEIVWKREAAAQKQAKLLLGDDLYQPRAMTGRIAERRRELEPQPEVDESLEQKFGERLGEGGGNAASVLKNVVGRVSIS